ncbi:hypothetical protein HF521_007457 [Silurus meridionalis]|uniref:SAP30-binding protein n=1 Tax=Silurus meridionalis TaxID=175797 RepID=A0A8T0ARL2_SILME|nr:hypothetical protein HF521_007457 [Silurus meridionalis]
MASGKKSALLSSLAAYGDDSEQDSDQDTDEHDAQGGLVSAGYGDDDIVHAEDGDERELGNEESDDDDGNSEVDDSDSAELHDDSKDVVTGEKKDPNELVAQFSEKVRNMSPEEIRIPPEPPGRCPSHLQEKIHKLYERKMQGDLIPTATSRRRKSSDMFDPHGWSEDSYYESLAKAQKIEMEKLEKAKKERTKIEFVTGMKKGTSTNSSAVTTNTTTTSTDAQKRKSKWDSAVPVTLSQPVLLTTTATLPGVVSVTTTASGTKTTVISAVGTILKKAKQ